MNVSPQVVGIAIAVVLSICLLMLLWSRPTCPRCHGPTNRSRYIKPGWHPTADVEREWDYCPNCGWSNRDNKTREERR